MRMGMCCTDRWGRWAGAAADVGQSPAKLALAMGKGLKEAPGKHAGQGKRGDKKARNACRETAAGRGKNK